MALAGCGATIPPPWPLPAGTLLDAARSRRGVLLACRPLSAGWAAAALSWPPAPWAVRPHPLCTGRAVRQGQGGQPYGASYSNETPCRRGTIYAVL